MARRDFEVTVAGGGPAGLVAALAMRSVLPKSAKIVDLDGSTPGGPKSIRTYAISPGSRNLLERLQVWRRLRRAQAIKSMDITDSRLEDYIRQTYLQFRSDAKAEALGWIVEHDDLIAALYAEAGMKSIDLRAASVQGISSTDGYASLTTGDGDSFTSSLIVASDGANSRVRDLLHIPVTSWSYSRTAIVATVQAELEHQGKAVQHFLPAGTFALLPLTGSRFSVVWVEKGEDALGIVNSPVTSIAKELQC